jgi:hypothetical protein
MYEPRCTLYLVFLAYCNPGLFLNTNGFVCLIMSSS